jgi:Domain of unknown function (DUF4410)
MKTQIGTTVIRVIANVVTLTGVVVPTMRAQSSVQKVMVGDATVTMLSSYQGAPLPKPSATVVYDFTVSDDIVQMDGSAAGRLLGHGPFSRAKGDPDATPEAVAENVEATFSKTLVSELGKTSIPTMKAESAYAKPAANTVVVHGEFTAVNQGDKTKRMMIGFGRGASDVQAHVTVTLTTDKEPIVLAEFDMKSDSGKKPGTAATMGAGSAAASVAAGGATDKKATVEGDATRMAKAVAKQVEAVMVQQKWIAVPQAQPAPQTDAVAQGK